MAVHSYAWVIFTSFLFVSGFILYSLVVAVVCDSFLVAESEFRAEMKEQNKHKKKKRKKNASERLQDELDSLLPPQQRRNHQQQEVMNREQQQQQQQNQDQHQYQQQRSSSKSKSPPTIAVVRNSLSGSGSSKTVQHRIRKVQQELTTLGAKQEEILTTLQNLVEQVDRPMT